MKCAKTFKDAYLSVLHTFNSDAILSIDDALPLCVTMNKAEYNFIAELLANMAGVSSYDYCEILFNQIHGIINIPEMFDDPRTPDDIPEISAQGENFTARLELFTSLCRGSEWFTDHYPPLNVGRLAGVADNLQNWLDALPAEENIPAASIPEKNQEAQEDKRDIPRSQSIALLYAVFVRLGVTQTHSATDISKLIEAVTGGKIRSGKNAYSASHLNDKLQDETAQLLDEFLPRGRSDK